ncbi:MAG: hypothetical protein ACI8PD_002178 [Nitrospinales bacterium]|jgi:hypothetical protein
MERGAVIIGVNKAAGLTTLNAAASGAEDFSDWATSQGYEVELLTDKSGVTVGIADIKKAIKSFVDKKTFSQLLVFFSGHGILKGPNYELWLLSNAGEDPNEAVNVIGSVFQARASGIPHVIFISDACRSKPDSDKLSQVIGSTIFPISSPSVGPLPEVDSFYATAPWRPALELPEAESVENYRGIFTEYLLKGLSGAMPGIIEELGDSHPLRWVVPSRNLKKYLSAEVPKAVSDFSIKLTQAPEVRVESGPPNYFAELNGKPAFFTVERGGQSIDDLVVETPAENLRSVVERSNQQNLSSIDPTSDDLRVANVDPSVIETFEKILNNRGREAFETQTGFTVMGGNVDRAILAGNGSCDVFSENNVYQIRVHLENPDQASSVLIQFSNMSGTVLAVIPGFIGTVTVEDGRVVNVNYTPSRGSNRYYDFEPFAEQIAQRRAFIATAAQHGAFRLEPDQARDVGRYLRVYKNLDPTLGIYASYAYAQSGALKGVESVYEYMKEGDYSSDGPLTVPFDVALLARKLPELYPFHQHNTAPFCPMLTQGWAFIEPYKEILSPVVNRAGHHLLPALWTTFNKEGVAILWDAIEKGELL